jgi:hypothetical protein
LVWLKIKITAPSRRIKIPHPLTVVLSAVLKFALEYPLPRASTPWELLKSAR